MSSVYIFYLKLEDVHLLGYYRQDKHRENYIGASLYAAVGRWQKGKDLQVINNFDINVFVFTREAF